MNCQCPLPLQLWGQEQSSVQHQTQTKTANTTQRLPRTNIYIHYLKSLHNVCVSVWTATLMVDVWWRWGACRPTEAGSLQHCFKVTQSVSAACPWLPYQGGGARDKAPPLWASCCNNPLPGLVLNVLPHKARDCIDMRGDCINMYIYIYIYIHTVIR